MINVCRCSFNFEIEDYLETQRKKKLNAKVKRPRNPWTVSKMRGIMQQALADTDNLFLTKAVADTLMGRTAADTVEYIDNVQGDILLTRNFIRRLVGTKHNLFNKLFNKCLNQ